MKKGDILVTEMTDPLYMLAIEKAKAIVTDVGGLLCHAAITSREMKIPCIVGIKNITDKIHELVFYTGTYWYHPELYPPGSWELGFFGKYKTIPSDPPKYELTGVSHTIAPGEMWEYTFDKLPSIPPGPYYDTGYKFKCVALPYWHHQNEGGMVGITGW